MTDADDDGLVDKLTAYATGGPFFSEKLKDTAWAARNRIVDLQRENAELKAALAEALKVIEPFVVFAENVDDGGWTSTIHRESISVWFGPSDFAAASAFLAKHGGRSDG